MYLCGDRRGVFLTFARVLCIGYDDALYLSISGWDGMGLALEALVACKWGRKEGRMDGWMIPHLLSAICYFTTFTLMEIYIRPY